MQRRVTERRGRKVFAERELFGHIGRSMVVLAMAAVHRILLSHPSFLANVVAGGDQT